MSLGDTALDKYQDIVIAPKAPAIVRKAATDLQYHLQKISGRPIPLVESSKAAADGLHFFVGSGVVPEQDDAISKLPREGWLIRSVPNGLLLAGDEKGTGSFNFIHAVSLFLEKHCGVKRVWPGEIGEIIPENPTLKIPTLDESGAPEVKRRRLDMSYATYWSKQSKDHLPIWWGRARLGDQFRAVFGHSWWGTMPPSEYFDKHPEWFGLVNGKRARGQLCPSNMQLRDEFLKRLLSRPDYKNLGILSVSANDGGGFCECDLCRAKDPGATKPEEYQNAAYWDFVSDIAQRIKKFRPELGVGTFAYTISRNPPKQIAKLPDNVYLSMTTYSTQMMLPEGKAQYQAFVDEWKSKGVKIVMREYWGMHYWMDLPIVYPEKIADTIKQGIDAGMMGTYGEATKAFSTQAPNYYVLTHQMWDPKADATQLVNEFYGTFGPAAKSVRAYYELMEDAVTQGWNKYKFLPGYTELVTHYADIFTPEVMAKANAHLDEAKGAAGDDTELQKRVAFVRTGCEYTTVMSELLGLYDKLGRSGVAIPTFNLLVPYSALSQFGVVASPAFYKFSQKLKTEEGRTEFEKTVNESTSYTPAERSNLNVFLKMIKTDDGRANFTKLVKQPFAFTPAQQKVWLERAWELGQKRIEILNRNRTNFALDEGLYALTLHRPRRQWHHAVGKALGKPGDEIATLEFTHPVNKR